MDISQLRSLLSVADEGSMTRAAAALYLTQPAVTQHIRALERELGVILLDRMSRGVQLTAAGEILRDYARRSLALLEEAKQVITDNEAGNTGRLLLGAGVTTSIFSLPSWLHAFHAAYPNVDVTVRTGRSQEVATMVLDREIDLGVVTSLTSHAELTVHSLYEEEIVLVAPPQELIAEQIALDRLADIPLILFPTSSGFRNYLDHILTGSECAVTVKMETDSVEAIKSFVMVGLGASFLPISAIEAECDAGTLMRVRVAGLPMLTRTTYAIHRKDRYMSTATRGFLEIATKPTR